jgi:hypothetical protein
MNYDWIRNNIDVFLIYFLRAPHRIGRMVCGFDSVGEVLTLKMAHIIRYMQYP